MKGLLKCYYGYRNRGDELLFFGVIQYLFEHYQDLTVLDVEVGDVSRMNQWCEMNPSWWLLYQDRVRFVSSRKLSMWVADYDIIFAGGGEVLAQKGRNPWHAGFNYLALFWRWIGTKRVVWLGGIETPVKWWSKLLYRMMLPYAREIVCREQGSYHIAKQYTDKVVLYHDFAIDVLQEVTKGKKRQQKSERVFGLDEKVNLFRKVFSGEPWNDSMTFDEAKLLITNISDEEGFYEGYSYFGEKLVGGYFALQCVEGLPFEFGNKITSQEFLQKIQTIYSDASIDTIWNLWNCFVDPQYQNQGIGTKLLYDFEVEAQKRGGTHVVLSTLRVGFQKEWYEANGYQSFRETENFGHELVFMVKKIDGPISHGSAMMFELGVTNYILINFIPKHTTPETITQFHEWIKSYPNYQIINFPAEEGDTLPDEITMQYGDRIQIWKRWEYDIGQTISLFRLSTAGFGQRLHFIIPCVYLGISHYRLVYSEKISKILEFFRTLR